MNAAKTSPTEAAAAFASKCNHHGWKWTIKGDTCVEVSTTFAPGDNDAYTMADSIGYELLALAPLKGGSIWGTDGGSVGGFVGLKGGYYRLNKSGSGAKRFLAELKKFKGSKG